MSTLTEHAGAGVYHADLLRILRDVEAALRRSCPSLVLGDERHSVVGLFDGAGAPLAVSRPVWLASLTATVQAVKQAFGASLEPGDVAVTNDPYAGGAHVNDLTLVRPDAAGTGYLAVRFHTADMGGERLGGTWPAASEVWQEGARLAPLRLQRGGRPDADIATLLAFNSRLPDLLRGDLAAAAAALDELERAIGAGGVTDLAPAVLGEARAQLDAQLSDLREGRWSAGGRIRHCCTGLNVPFELRLSVAERRIRFDFPAEPDAVAGFVNSSDGTTCSALMAPLVAALGDRACNAALLAAIDVVTTPGSLFHALAPRPTGYAPYITSAELARRSAELLVQAGLPVAPFGHWFASPALTFAVPACDDPACPFAGFQPDTHHTRYAPEARV